jgi:nucleoside-diphosphate-sugar epimerase
VTRILLTGATGFIGRHCLERLQREDCEIDAISRTPRDSRNGRVRWHAADLREPDEASRIVATLRPTHVLHLAWEATPRLYSRSPENLRWLQATIAMATAFGETGGRRFVGAGTSAEYDSVDSPCVEDATPIRPTTIYGRCKAACWLALEAAAQHHGFATAWGRIFLPYGPGDPPARLIPSVLTALAEGRPVETTEGRQQRDFISRRRPSAGATSVLRRDRRVQRRQRRRDAGPHGCRISRRTKRPCRLAAVRRDRDGAGRSTAARR